MDYGALSTTLMFEACETRQCDYILIVDDVTLEMTESFSVILKRTLGLSNSIIVDPVDGKIDIFDNDDCKQNIIAVVPRVQDRG